MAWHSAPGVCREGLHSLRYDISVHLNWSILCKQSERMQDTRKDIGITRTGVSTDGTILET